MINSKVKQQQKVRRAARVRAKVKGTAERPRLSVFRSNKYLYAQLIDDTKGITLVSSNTRDLKVKENKARTLGADIATKAKALGITKVVFDRSGYRYMGQIALLAEAAREAGLEF